MQSSEDEVLLRQVLYDAIILVEYSFLNPERVIHLPAEHMKSIAMKRLIVTHEAVEYFRYEKINIIICPERKNEIEISISLCF